MWVQIILFVVSLVVSYLLQPKPQNAKPGKVEVPNIEEGRPITVLYGSRWIASPTVAWWGDILTTPVHAEGGKK
ncbi:hypothetical protein SFMTTN_2022 [Sulfuriferula multivorans]|uniref:Uncharacterized protein n=1 Tax=Sulfuriferula multivorans TaxID=1559896 RepID=A0A401JF01_9PROT|nr:hypothetical protein [Sulfuriferula multivorans]GBL46209.1 hypothetical protein SFMTTN_2022 [Sulfuriferula multivorans]